MKVVDGAIEIDGDDALRRAQLIKIVVQTVAVVVMALANSQLLFSDEVQAVWKSRIKKWRNEFFGPPPLTEEQIQEQERQVIVEALRTVREAQ